MACAKVMIVEDEVITALATERMLERLGYVVCGNVSSGEAALKVFDGARPDIVLMDIRLNGELDGIETTRRLKQRRDVAVIYLSANSDDSTRQRAYATNPLAFMVKPLDLALLKSVLDKAGAARS